MQNPGACFIKAAKAGVVDDLKGNLDALAWGKVPSTGTAGHFDIIYSAKVDFILLLPDQLSDKIRQFTKSTFFIKYIDSGRVNNSIIQGIWLSI